MIFRRDRVTVLAYGVLGSYAFCLYGLGPELAFLRDELHLSYTQASLHSTVWAAGTILTGLLFGNIARRLGRWRLFWLAAAGTAAGTLLFSVSHVLALTLLAAATLGTAGTTLQSATSVVLSDRHGLQRDRALVEANVFASAAALCAPALLGVLARTSVGWRPGLAAPAILLAVLYLVYRREQLASANPDLTISHSGARLPRAYWLYGALLAAVVGAEFSVVFFGAALIRATTGVEVAVAATAMSLFFAGEFVGRVAGSNLTRNPGRAWTIIAGALATAGVGFVMVWASPSFAVTALGLVVTGLGIANLYPLSLSLALAAAPGQVELATARTQLLVGSAVIGAPFALAAIADQAGIRGAFALVLGLIALAVGLLAASRWTAGKGAAEGPTAPSAD